MNLRWLALVLALGAGCIRAPHAGSSPDAAAASDPVPEPGFAVRPGSSDLLFSWYDAQGASHAVPSLAEVPEGARDLVRVDPSRPELRRAGWIFVATLRTPGADGSFPVRAVRAESLATVLRERTGLAANLGTNAGAADTAAAAQGTGQVIVYGASWCSACHQAMAYLQRRHIPYVEKDIERDAAAAQEMQAKARRAGVPTGSIPILDVRGHIMVGFNPEAIERALAGT